MLHRIKIPDCSNKLETILSFQYHILTFACNLSDNSDLEEGSLIEEFDENGKWLYKKLWKNEGGSQRIETDFCKEFIKFRKYIKSNPNKKEEILNAFLHDIKFHTHLNDSDFRFSYTVLLDELTKSAVKPIMVAFYEFLNSGFALCFEGSQIKINRDTLIVSFFESNPNLEVCPACDGSRPDKIDSKIYADADHFLPKSRYPFLSVHPANIVPLCLECNRLFKLSFDPIDEPNNAPLLNSFHPYGRCAIENIDIKVVINDKGVRRILIVDKDGMQSRRVKNLNDTLKLEQRWKDRLRQSIDSIMEELSREARKIKSRKSVPMNSEDLKIELEDMLSLNSP